MKLENVLGKVHIATKGDEAMVFIDGIDLVEFSKKEDCVFEICFVDKENNKAIAFGGSKGNGFRSSESKYGLSYITDVDATGLYLLKNTDSQERGFLFIDKDFNPNLITEIQIQKC